MAVDSSPRDFIILKAQQRIRKTIQKPREGFADTHS